MAKQQRTGHSSSSTQTSTPIVAAPEPEVAPDSNAAAQEELVAEAQGSGGQATGTPGGGGGGAPSTPGTPGDPDPMSAATAGGGVEVPYRTELEAQFGQPLGHVHAYLGQRGAMDAIGANAAARGTDVVFAETEPDKELVAQEVAHVLQTERTSGTAGQGTDISSPTDASEREAKGVASEVAAGGSATVSGQASASIHRDETPGTGVCYETREEVRGEFTLVVHPDEDRSAVRRPDRDGKWHCREIEFTQFASDLADMAILRTAVLEVAARGSRDPNFAHDLAEVLRNKSVESRRYLRLDPVFLRDPTFTTDPTALVRIANATAPATLFSEAVTAARTGGTTGDALVDFIREFARAHPADAVVVLQTGTFYNGYAGLTEAQRFTAMAYLGNGGADLNAVAQLRIALESRDAAAFRTHFETVSGDAAMLAPFRNDATFLNLVRDRFPADVYELVQQRMLLGAAADNSDLGLTEQERGAIRQFAGVCCTALRAEFTATFYTSDANVQAALEAYFRNVDNVLSGVVSDEARRSKIEEARTLLKTLYRDTYHTSIAGGLRAGVEGDALTTCLGLIAERAGDTVDAITAERARAAGTAEPAATAGPAEHLTPEERTSLQPALDTAIAAIHREDDSMWMTDAVVTGAIRTYRTAVETAVVAADETVAEQNAMRRRRSEGVLLLETEYERIHSKPLADVLAGGMDGRARDDAISVFEDARLSRDTEADATEYVAAEGAPLSAAELQRVTPLARQHAQGIHSVVEAMVVNDIVFHARVRSAHTALEDAVSPESAGQTGPVTAQMRIAWRAKSAAAMAVLSAEYDALFGSLVQHLHMYLQDEEKRRECLTWLGDRGGPIAGAVDEVLGSLEGAGVSAEDQDAYGQRLEEMERRIIRLAEDFADELDDTVVHDSVVLRLSRSFQTIKTEYADLVGRTDRFSESSFLQYLERAYLPLGGSLRSGIVAGCDRDNAETAFTNLGLGSVDAALSRIDESDLTPAEIDAGLEMHRPGQRLFEAIERLRHLREMGRTQVYPEEVRPVVSAIEAYKTAAGTQPIDFLNEFYQREHYVLLGTHLGRHLPDAHRSDAAALLPGMLIGPYGFTAPDATAAIADAEREAGGAPEDVPEELRFDPLRCSPGFSVTVASERARRVHDAVNGTYDRDALVRVLTGGDAGGGHTEENRVVRAMYLRMYGVEMQYDIHRVATLFTQEDDARFIEGLAENAGQVDDFTVEIRQEIRVGSDGALNNVYSKVLMGSREQRQQLLADPTVFTEIRSAWGAEAMDRVYRSATGEITLADMLRTRDESTEWYTFGFGTDEEGSRDDVTLFFRYLRRELGIGLDADGTERTPEERAAALDAAVKARARAMLADSDVRQMLDGEFSGADLLQIEQLIAGAGSAEGGATAEHALSDGDAAALIAQLREMSDEELSAARSDPGFVERVRRGLSGRERAEAMGLLFGSHDSTEFADLEAALTAPEHTSGAGSTSTIDSGGRDTLFDAVLAMDADELARLADDPLQLARIRSGLRTNPTDLALFEQLIGGIDTDGGHLRGASELGAAGTAAGAPMSDADKQRIRDSIVIRLVIALTRAARMGEDHLYAAAQQAYNEEGETTVQADPERKEDLFRDAERQTVWGQVQSAVATAAGYDAATQTRFEDNPQYFAVKQAVLHEADPSGRRLDRGFEWWDNDEAIDGAIDDASPAYVAREMSNICSPGPGGTDTMALVYTRYDLARALRDQRRAELGLATTDGEREAAQQALQAAENDLLLKQHAFVDFRLDISDLFAMRLSQAGGTHMERRDGDAGFGAALVGTGDARYLALVSKVRGRVLGLSSADVAEALDIPTEAYTEAEIPDEATRTAREAYRTEDIGALMTDDRKDRARASHAVDTYVHHRGEGSLADAGRSDEAVDLEYSVYMGEVGRATEGDSATGTVGTIDRDEHERIGERREDFEESIQALTAARAALRDVLKWIAMAIITLVATALTGPGGPTLLAAMCTAAASAGATAVINEATMGRDYEFWQEGMRDVVVQTATAAVTFGLSQASTAAIRNSPFLQSASDKLARFNAWEAGLREGAGQSIEGFGQFVVYSGGRAALGTALSDFEGAVVGSIDPAQWKYGFDQGFTHTSRTMDGAMDNVGEHMWDSFWTTMVTSGAGVIRGRLMPKPRREGALDGVEVPEAEERAREVSMWDSLQAGAGEALSGRALAESGFDYTVRYMVGRARDGDWEFDGDDIGDFMGGYIENRATAVLDATGEDLAEARASREAARVFEENREAFDRHAATLGPNATAARAHFRHFLTSGVRDYDAAFTEWQASWGDVERRLRLQLDTATNPADQAGYREWALSDPTKIDERLRHSPSDYAAARADLASRRAEIERSPEFQALDPEQRQFYLQYLSAPGRISGGASLAPDTIDVREGTGRTRLREAYGATKRAVVLHHLTDELQTLSEADRTTFTTFLNSADPSRDLPAIDPSNTSGSQATVEGWFTRYRERLAREAAARRAPGAGEPASWGGE